MYNNCKVLYDKGRYMEVIDLLNSERSSSKKISKYCVYHYLWSLHRLYLSKQEYQRNTSRKNFNFVINEMRRLAPENQIFADIIERQISSRKIKDIWSIDEYDYNIEYSIEYCDFDDIAAREQGNI